MHGFLTVPYQCAKGHLLPHCPGRFGLDVRRHFFPKRVVTPCNRLPGEVVDAPCLSVLKRHLDNALNTMPELSVSPEVVG